MSTPFTNDQLEHRIASFHQYALDQQLQITYLGKARKNDRPFLVEKGDQFLEITFSVHGGVVLSQEDASSMDVQTIARPWVEQEQPRYHRVAFSQRALWFAAARHPHLFQRPPTGENQILRVATLLQLQPEDHPLVDLASRLHYKVFLGPSDHSIGREERYHVIGKQNCLHTRSLIEALVLLFTGQQENKEEALSTSFTSQERRSDE